MEEDTLAEFREALQPGMPVHIYGLMSKPELDGVTGWLRTWHADRGRWAVEVGGENLLLKRGNLHP